MKDKIPLPKRDRLTISMA